MNYLNVSVLTLLALYLRIKYHETGIRIDVKQGIQRLIKIKCF
jgi:hypothetical protein